MKALIVSLSLVSIAMLTPAAAQSAEVFCGRILGSQPATATAPGSFVIVRPGDAPAPSGGTFIALRAGTQFSVPTGWVCVRATAGGPSVAVPGSPSGTTHTFVAFVAQGEPGFQPEPTAAPTPTGSPATGRTGTLPSTSTASGGDALGPLVLLASLVLVALRVARGRPVLS